MQVSFQTLLYLSLTGYLLFPILVGGQNERAEQIHREALTIDTHCDTPLRMMDDAWKIGERHEPDKIGSGKIDLPRMREGGLDAIFFAVFVGQGERTPDGYARAQLRADKLLDKIHQMYIEYPELAEFAATPDDAYRIEKTGKRAIYIGMENGYPIGMDLSKIRSYYERGIRYITLCHTKNNDICDSSTDPEGPQHHGLSPFGEQVIGEMNRLGVIVDVSHISDEAFFDVLKTSKTPVIASHSCARALCDNPRNLSDDMLKALAVRGGVMQMCILSDYVKTIPLDSATEAKRKIAFDSLSALFGDWDKIEDETIRRQYRHAWHAVYRKYPSEKATVSDVVDHIDHVVNLVGIDHIGIGTDFDGGGGVNGCNEVSEMGNITRELVSRGYSESEIRKIWGENFMRIFRKVERFAKSGKPVLQSE
ncbi:dipeptidase [candidate division KSB1 bacterium]|nr:dipeptidase [candidate division KSB1 bacterium]